VRRGADAVRYCLQGLIIIIKLHEDHHHQIKQPSHSINAIGPAPHRGGRKREHSSIMFAISFSGGVLGELLKKSENRE
jgi:hypothetical protein